MVSAPPATCATHRRRERVATCGVCGAALCIDCVVHTSVGVKCRKCTGGARATSPGATAKARGVEPRGGKRRWPVPVAIAGAVLVLAASFAVFDGGSSSKSTVAATGSNSATSPTTASVSGTATAPGITDKKADFVGGGGLRVGATLSVPTSLGNKTAPGVLIVPGGGAMDRNGGVQLTTNLPDPLYQDLAQSFAQAGMVALRYDRRGTGTSQLGQGVPLTWDGLIADAKAGLDFLGARKETEGQPLAVVGYDQGGFVALRLAQTDPATKGIVLISTPGRPLPQVIASDLMRGITDPVKAQTVFDAMNAATAQLLSTGKPPDPNTLPEELQSIFKADPPYLTGLFSFDPVAEAAKVTVPALVVRGGLDGSILPMDVQKLQAALTRSTTLTSPLGDNTLALPQGQEGRFHDPSRHGTTRDGDALISIDDWLKANVKL